MRGIKSSSKRKWIVGGAVIFGAVALLTTGFATWIVGAQNNASQGVVNVSVDTAANNFLEFSYDLEGGDNEIALAEDLELATNTPTGSVVSVEGNDFQEAPLEVSGVVTVLIGKTYLQEHTLKKISFNIDESAEGAVSVVADANNNFLKDDEKVGSVIRANSDSYTYIKAPADIDFGTNAISISTTNGFWTVSQNGDMFTFRHTFAVDFRWGTFFGNVDDTTNNSPYQYYNSLTLPTDAEQKANIYGAVTAELEAMRTQLDGKTIKLIATLN